MTQEPRAAAAATDPFPGVVVVVVLPAQPPSALNCCATMNDNRPTIRAITNEGASRLAAVTLVENEHNDSSRYTTVTISRSVKSDVAVYYKRTAKPLRAPI